MQCKRMFLQLLISFKKISHLKLYTLKVFEMNFTKKTVVFNDLMDKVSASQPRDRGFEP